MRWASPPDVISLVGDHYYHVRGRLNPDQPPPEVNARVKIPGLTASWVVQAYEWDTSGRLEMRVVLAPA